MPPLNDYQSIVHSQNGEDGVIAEILRRIGNSPMPGRWCVEVGASDGVSLSNTLALVELGWNAVYIEGDAARFQSLLATAKALPTIIPINAFVGRGLENADSLDKILGATPLPQEFEVLSIDIDSYDCDVWESLVKYSPRVVVIEINSSIPPGIIWRHSRETPGNTFTATCSVARRKGYTAVCHTGNLIFVRDDLVAAVGIEQRYIDYPELLFLFDSPWMANGPYSWRRFRESHPKS